MKEATMNFAYLFKCFQKINKIEMKIENWKFRTDSTYITIHFLILSAALKLKEIFLFRGGCEVIAKTRYTCFLLKNGPPLRDRRNN
ncbi:hypothetical protein BpHYR1_016420 [Brachionus plicatilis]|uniref:Uncharacterized protein n=1 Tax=Brachionus plicatilis TaxID=10195 RepID=A0A3M7T299_BRAPC|nr:hypothetical protein BpHYR1_016420 [Brachionus plicatilis]